MLINQRAESTLIIHLIFLHSLTRAKGILLWQLDVFVGTKLEFTHVLSFQNLRAGSAFRFGDQMEGPRSSVVVSSMLHPGWLGA